MIKKLIISILALAITTIFAFPEQLSNPIADKIYCLIKPVDCESATEQEK